MSFENKRKRLQERGLAPEQLKAAAHSCKHAANYLEACADLAVARGYPDTRHETARGERARACALIEAEKILEYLSDEMRTWFDNGPGDTREPNEASA